MLGTTSSERWAGVWALAGGMALLYVNTTMVNVALPDLGSSIHAGNRALQWIVSSYTLGFLAALLPGGLLGDSIGHRRLLLIGVCLFGVGAAVPLFSPTVIGLLVGRAVMGLGASVFTPMSLALIPWLVQAPYRARATAIWSAAGSLGAPLGPILGGLAIDNWGWKAMFAIDFVGALALVMVLAACIPPDPMRPVRRAAPAPQILLSTSGFILITAGLINSPGGYMATTSGVAALIVCLVVDSRTQSPLADLSLLRNHHFRTSAMGLMVVNLVLFGVLFIVPGFIQSVLGHSAVAGGLMLLPMAAATGLGSFAAARASKHPQSAQLALPSGLVLIGIGMGIAATKVVSGAAPIMAGLTLLGLGQGLSQSFALAHAMDQVDEEAHGTAAALINTIRQIGSMLGIAILGSLLGNRYTRAVTSQSTHLPEFIVKQINTGIGVAKATAPQFPGLRDQIDATANTAYVTAMDSVLALCSVTVIVSALLLFTTAMGRTSPSRVRLMATSRSRAAKKLELRRKIRSAAIDLFTARGYAETTVEEVAAAADVSPMTVYRHFGTKESLVLSVAKTSDVDVLLAAVSEGHVLDAASLADAMVAHIASNPVEQLYQRVVLITSTPELGEALWTRTTTWTDALAPHMPATTSLARRAEARSLVAVGLEGLLAWPATSTQPDVRLLKQCLTESFQVWLTGSQPPEA